MEHRHLSRPFARACAPVMIATTAVVLAAGPAGAHVDGPVHGLGDGALHPLTGPDHLLAMIAVGVVGALLGARRTRTDAMAWWLVPVAFLVGMAFGGGLGLAGTTLPATELAIAGSVVVLGVAVALAPRLATPGVLALVLVAGMAHGNAHGAEAPGAVDPLLYVAGFLLTTAGLHAAGVMVGARLRRPSLVRTATGITMATTGVLLVV
jgi:urease accessory protein